MSLRKKLLSKSISAKGAVIISSLLYSASIMMKVFVILSAVVILASAKPRHSPKIGIQNGRIIGGQDAEPHAYPWQISMKSLGQHFCGGSIINERQILSAAHCVEGQIAFLDAVSNSPSSPFSKILTFL